MKLLNLNTLFIQHPRLQLKAYFEMLGVKDSKTFRLTHVLGGFWCTDFP